MIRAIAIGSCITVQGVFVSHENDGKISVQLDGKTFIGRPVLPLTHNK